VHELGLCAGILEAVERRAQGRRVTRVRVRVGARHRVVESAFEQSFELVARGSLAEGAVLDLVVVPVRVTCDDCGNQAESTDALAACPACGGLDLATEGGDELILEAIQLEEPHVSRHPG
jgi:hydrogenase nickel incorporation protein HypA/HybF